MRKWIFVLSAIFITILATNVWAADKGSCGENCFYQFSGGTLTIKGTGEMKNYSASSQPWADIIHLISKVEIKNGITNIGTWAFDNALNLTQITIPESVVSIGGNSLWNTGITDIILTPNPNFLNWGSQPKSETTVHCSVPDITLCSSLYLVRSNIKTDYQPLPRRRIYTIEEANEVAGERNTFRIKYR